MSNDSYEAQIRVRSWRARHAPFAPSWRLSRRWTPTTRNARAGQRRAAATFACCMAAVDNLWIEGEKGRER